MLSNNPIEFVNKGLYCVHDEILYLDRNISLAIPWDQIFIAFFIYFFLFKRKSFKVLERCSEKKIIKQDTQFSRGADNK